MRSKCVEGKWPADVCAISKPMNRVAGAARRVAAWEVGEVMPDYTEGKGEATPISWRLRGCIAAAAPGLWLPATTGSARPVAVIRVTALRTAALKCSTVIRSRGHLLLDGHFRHPSERQLPFGNGSFVGIAMVQRIRVNLFLSSFTCSPLSPPRPKHQC